MTKLFVKKVNGGVLGPRRKFKASAKSEIDRFSLEAFDESPYIDKIDELGALYRGKLDASELDSACAPVIAAHLLSIERQAEKDLAAWKLRCELELSGLCACVLKEKAAYSQV